MLEQLHVDKRKVDLNLSGYNELVISKKIFTQTKNIFKDLEDRHIKGLCVFQLEAVRVTDDNIEEKRDIYFTSNTDEFHATTYAEKVGHWSQQLSTDIDDWVENGSGFNISKIVRAYCTFVTYSSEFGGADDSPNKFYCRGRVLHVINTPTNSVDCLKTCINIIKNGYIPSNKSTRVDRNLIGVVVDWKTLEQDPVLDEQFADFHEPFHLHDIPLIAKLTGCSFNVFRLHRKGNKFSITTLFNGGCTNTGELCNILYYNDHFYVINNLDKLILAITKRKRNMCKICINCLNYIDKRYTPMAGHYNNCRLSKGTITKYAKEGEVRKFAQHYMQVDSPFYIVADFEATNSKEFQEDSTARNTVERVHRLNSYCFYLYINPYLDNFPYHDFQTRLFWEFATDDSVESEQKLTGKFFQAVNKIATNLSVAVAEIY